MPGVTLWDGFSSFRANGTEMGNETGFFSAVALPSPLLASRRKKRKKTKGQKEKKHQS